MINKTTYQAQWKKESRKKWKALGLCGNCGNTKELSKYALCNRCREKYRTESQKKRKECIAAGICATCRKQPLIARLTCCEKCQLRQKGTGKEATKRTRHKAKFECFQYYGSPYCNCCKQKFDSIFLTIDHVNNDGNIHRKQTHGGGANLYSWLIRNDYPDGFQLLCHNCNYAKGLNGGICPHQDPDYVHITF